MIEQSSGPERARDVGQPLRMPRHMTSARMGTKMSFTQKPTAPAHSAPRPTRVATRLNSVRSGLVQRRTRRVESVANWRADPETTSSHDGAVKGGDIDLYTL